MSLPKIVWAIIGRPKFGQSPLLNLYSTYEEALLAQLKIKLKSLYILGGTDVNRLHQLMLNLPPVNEWEVQTIQLIKDELQNSNSEIRPTVIQVSRWEEELEFVPQLFDLISQICKLTVPLPNEAEVVIQEGFPVITWFGTISCSSQELHALVMRLLNEFSGNVNLEQVEKDQSYDLVISPWSLPIQFIFELI